MPDKFTYEEGELRFFNSIEDAKTYNGIINAGKENCQKNFNEDDWYHGDGSHTCENCPLDKNNMCISENGKLYINAPDNLYDLLKSLKTMLTNYGFDFKIQKKVDNQKED